MHVSTFFCQHLAMPELPEVETTRRGLCTVLAGRTVDAMVVRNPRLRQPVDPKLPALLNGQTLNNIERRAKYLLFNFSAGCLIVHLGMSGSLRIVPAEQLPAPHDHIDLGFGTQLLRYRDPRRFGLWQWWPAKQPIPRLLARLGIEPLDPRFDGQWLYQATRQRRTPIKPWLMNPQWIVGVGNIYACESLFRARIDPATPAQALSLACCTRLADAIVETLRQAIEQGGSTLRDFVGGDGRPGYFQQTHAVYDREGLPCPVCGSPISRTIQAQRSTFHCPQCQRHSR